MARPDAYLADRGPGRDLEEVAAKDLALRRQDLRFESMLVGGLLLGILVGRARLGLGTFLRLGLLALHSSPPSPRSR